MYVFLGETIDRDYEEFIGGMHKTLILKGIVIDGSEKMLRSPTSYGSGDVFPSESPNIVSVTVSDDDKEGFSSKQIIASLHWFEG